MWYLTWLFNSVNYTTFNRLYKQLYKKLCCFVSSENKHLEHVQGDELEFVQ